MKIADVLPFLVWVTEDGEDGKELSILHLDVEVLIDIRRTFPVLILEAAAVYIYNLLIQWSSSHLASNNSPSGCC